MKHDNSSRFTTLDGKPVTGKTKRFYARFIQPGDLVFDIGANVGLRTESFLSLGAQVVAVEPLKENIRVLFALFHDQPVTFVTKAVGDTIGDGEMVVSTPNVMGSSLNKQLHQVQQKHPAYIKTKFTERRTVKVTTLDALIAEHGRPTFIKIDVEGHEPAVFQGLSQPIPALSFEFISFYLDSALACFPHLDRLGRYVCNVAAEEKFDWILDRWVSGAEMITVIKEIAAAKNVLYGDIYVKFID